jgi:hypothetical protein
MTTPWAWASSTPEAHGPPGERHAAGVGRLDPGQDLHQRRLAGAVLADQRVHLAGLEVEVDARQRGDLAEALVDAGHLQQAHPLALLIGPAASRKASISAAVGSEGWAPGRRGGQRPAALA